MKRATGIWIAIAAIIGIYFGFSVLCYFLAGIVPVWLTHHNLLPGYADVIAAAANFLTLMLIGVMILATLLTLAERKWSAMMQDRVGPNRARFAFAPNRPLAGLPHMVSDVLKMLTKEGFAPDEASQFLFKLAPVLNFAPVFCLFAIIPVGPVLSFGPMGNGAIFHSGLQVSSPDFGLLYIFALASIAVYGTALAGWASNNKFALLGGVRATSQMISYEVALGLSLVGMMMVANSLKMDSMVDVQGIYLWSAHVPFIGQMLDVGLPAWGIFIQPLGFILFFTAAFAETKRAPFDLPEGESEVIGYFVEYSGMGFGLFMIAEFVEVVVLSAMTAAIFFGGYHLPFGEQWLRGMLDAHVGGIWGGILYGSILATGFWVKVLLLCYVQLAVRWSFPRFRYDQIQKLGWKMLLPAGLINVFVSGALLLWDPSMHALAVVGFLEIAALIAIIPAKKVGEASAVAPAGAHGGHAPAAAGHGGGH